MGKIITIAQQKGGAGKTSIAVHLATQWAAQKKNVALVDGDPQGSLNAWFGIRQGVDAVREITFERAEGWKASTVVAKLARTHDYVIVDTAPHAETATRTVTREADLVIVPMQPSPLDFWATAPSLEMIAGEKRPYLAVLNRVPPRSGMADTVAQLAAEQDITLAKARLGNRQDFAASLMAGKGVAEFKPRSRAAEEIKALAREIARKAG